MKKFGIAAMIAGIVAFSLSAAGTIELTCFKSARENGRGFHFRLPRPVTDKSAQFRCEAVIEPVQKLPDQGLRAMLMLTSDPFRAGAGREGCLLSGVEFYQGVSRHAIFRTGSGAGPELKEQKFDNWSRLPAGTPVRIEISYDGTKREITLNFTAKEGTAWKKVIPVGAEEHFQWNYFSLVSFRPSGAEALRDNCRVSGFQIDGQELQAAEFRPEPEGLVEITTDAPELTAYLNSEVRPALPVPGEPLFNTLDWKNFPCNSFEYAKYEEVAVPDRKFPSALRMTGLKRPITFHTVQIASRRNEKPIRKGDVIFLQYDARCLSSSDESGDGRIGVGLVVDGRTWQDWGFVNGDLTREWRRFYGYGVAKSDLPAGKLRVHLFLSHRFQTIEIGGIAALNLGQGIDPKTLPANRIDYVRPSQEWRRQAESNIEKYRKGDLRITLTDAEGKPLTGAPVKLEMISHAFGFGCYADDAPVLMEGADGDRFRKEFVTLFNRAIVPMFWGPGNAENGAYGWENPVCRDRYLRIAKWCHENGLTTQAHVLTWPSSMYVPPDVPALKATPEKLQQRTVAHIRDVIAANGDSLDEYQVLNEPCATREFIDAVGMDAVAGWFRAARAAAPGKPLVINDNGILSKYPDKQEDYEALIMDLLKRGAPVDGIGFQGHIGSSLPPPELLWRIFDRFGKFGLPIHITEFTVSLEDAALQAEYTGDFLLAAFSHPAVESVTQWGFWAGKHYDPRVALFSREWKLRPNGEVYRDLVLKQWRTNVDGATGEDGVFATRAFYGDYRVTVSLPDGGEVSRSIRFRAGGPPLTIRF